MFRAEEIQARLNEKPFRPLRLIVSEGLRYDIVHPDLVLVGSRDMTIGFPGPKHPKIYDRLIRIAYIHLVGIEDLPVQATSSNGAQPG